MKVCIVGSHGYVGRRLQERLQAEGIQVRGASSSDGSGIDPHTGVLSESFSIPADTYGVVYLAQSPYYNRVPEMFPHLVNVNVVSAVKAAELSRRAKVKRFIYASTGNVYAPDFNPLPETAPVRRDNWYALSKVHAEEALSLYRNDMDMTVIRPFGIYGPGQANKLVPNLLKSLLEGKEISLDRNPYNPDDLDGLRVSLCYIDDAVAMIASLLTKNGPDYLNIAGDTAASIRQIVTLMAGYLGKEAKFTVLERRRQSDLIADISRLRKVLNPVFTGLEAGIKRTVAGARMPSDENK